MKTQQIEKTIQQLISEVGQMHMAHPSATYSTALQRWHARLQDAYRAVSYGSHAKTVAATMSRFA